MRRTILGAATLLLIPVIALAQGAPQAAPQPPASNEPAPKMDIIDKIKDFGSVAKGEKLNHTFEVRNLGNAPLELTQVRPTCGCTVANYDKTIAPGATGKISAEVDTSTFLGPISKVILVYTNDPAMNNVSLVIKADVRAFIEVRPRPLLRFNVLQGEPATEKLTLIAPEGATFKVTGADTGGGPYQVAFRELAEKERIAAVKGSQWELTVTVPADAPEGVLTHKIEVKTDNEKAPGVPVSVTGVVRPIIQVIPAELNFGSVPGDAPVGRNLLLINNRQGAQLELKGAEVDNSDFKVEVIPLEAGQRFQVAVSMPAGLAKGHHKGTLKISTNDPSRKAIQVPVLAIVQ